MAGRAFGAGEAPVSGKLRRRTPIHEDWRFTMGDPPNSSVSLLYDLRPQPAARGTAAVPTPEVAVVKSWILPTGNDFTTDPAKRARRPEGNLGDGVSYI